MTREEAIGEITYLVYSNPETMGSARMRDWCSGERIWLISS